MELVVRGRNVEVPEHFRTHVGEKLSRVQRYDTKIIHTDVELLHERNPRQSETCQRVEITCRVRGPVVRAEASAADFYAALDLAVDKLEARFRRSADRRRIHHGRRRPASLATAAAEPTFGDEAERRSADGAVAVLDELSDEEPPAGELTDTDSGPGRVVREKTHAAIPMNIDQALLEMELVGHDFYLFQDADTGLASVVYRRRAYDYGVIRLGE
jgi:ribosomal subunit interface protein